MRAALADPLARQKNSGFSRYAVSVSNRGTPHGPALTFTAPPHRPYRSDETSEGACWMFSARLVYSLPSYTSSATT